MGSQKHDERLDYALGIDAKDMADGCLDYGLMLPEYEHPEELRIRQGMPNALNKLIGGGRVAVGYIGGSITQQNGWRPRTTAWLKSRFSSAQIVEINAAISGTAADFGAARIDEHVLAYDPDLVFVEFVVNGGDIPSMEGLVRKIRKRNPHTDICFVYTLKADRIPSYQPGAEPILPDSLTAFEAVADHYGIPSIDFGYVLGDLYAKDRLVPVAKEEIDPAGRFGFSKDGVHPIGPGDQLYAGAVARSILRMEKRLGPPVAHPLPDPLSEKNWENATMANADLYNTNLEVLNTKDDDFGSRFPYRGQNFGMIRSIFPSLVKLAAPGDSVTVRFRGTRIGIADAGGPFSGQLRAVIDGHTEQIVNRFSPYNANLRHQVEFLPELEEGEHTVTFTLMSESPDKRSIIRRKEDYDRDPEAFRENEVYLGKFLVVGEFLSIQ